MSRSESILTRTGGQSFSASSSAKRVGSQYWRNRSPIGVPGPVWVRSSLTSFLSILLLSGFLDARCGALQVLEHDGRGLFRVPLAHRGHEGGVLLGALAPHLRSGLAGPLQGEEQ